MKTNTEHSKLKSSEYQMLMSSNAQLKAQANGEQSDPSLMDEFSAILDKIADQLHENISDSYQDVIGSALSAGAVAPTQKQKTQERNKTEDTEFQVKASEEKREFKAEVIRNEKEESKPQTKEQESNSPEQKEAVSLENKSAKPKEDNSKSAAESKKTETEDAEVPESISTMAKQAVTEELTKKSDKDFTAVDKNVSVKTDASKAEVQEEMVAEETPAAVKTQLNLAPVQTEEQAVKSEKAATAKSEVMNATVVQTTNTSDIRDIASLLLLSRNALGGNEGIKQLMEQGGVKGVTASASASGPGIQDTSIFAKKGSEEMRELRSKNSNPLTNSQALKTMDRIESALKEAAKARDGKTISLRLDPPELGSVKIDVTLKDGTLHARISADANNVNQMLKDKALDLQASLRKLGINVERITVAVGSENFSEASFDNSSAFNNQNFSSNKENNPASEGVWSDLGDAGVVASETQKQDNVKDHWIA